jgi:hypothetical protein
MGTIAAAGRLSLAMTIIRLVHFAAIMLAVVVLLPAGAHFFELPHKMRLTAEQYLAVQSIYAGWSLFGVAFLAALVAEGALAVLTIGKRQFWFAIVAFFATLAALAVFFAWTFPANQQTANWTELPANWQQLRTQWEYSHAGGALLDATAVIALVIAALRRA